MKVGDYVRTDEGIRKIVEIDRQYVITDFSFNEYSSNLNDRKSLENDMIKSSPSIIDLIKVGDYVNGFKVLYKGTDTDDYGNDYQEVQVEKEGFINYYLKEKDIKSILTKEQFEAIKYEIK